MTTRAKNANLSPKAITAPAKTAPKASSKPVKAPAKAAPSSATQAPQSATRASPARPPRRSGRRLALA